MLDKIKKYVSEHKFDLIERGSMIIGAIIGVVFVGVTLVAKNHEPFEENPEIDI